MAFSDVTAAPVMVFLVVSLSVLTGRQLTLSLAIFILSMSRFVADNTAYFVVRALIFLFDANTSVGRIQVYTSHRLYILCVCAIIQLQASLGGT